MLNDRTLSNQLDSLNAKRAKWSHCVKHHSRRTKNIVYIVSL